jgi:hypothetical protein
MKIVHTKTQFKFTVDDESYIVVCPASKHNNHSFIVFKEDGQKYVNTYCPTGGHVNKTGAKRAIEYALQDKHN